MRTKLLFDLDKKVFVIAIKPHWWSKWIIDYCFSTNAYTEAIDRKKRLRKINGLIHIIKEPKKNLKNYEQDTEPRTEA